VTTPWNWTEGGEQIGLEGKSDVGLRECTTDEEGAPEISGTSSILEGLALREVSDWAEIWGMEKGKLILDKWVVVMEGTSTMKSEEKEVSLTEK
jgi:hypothetical protein